MPKGSIYSDLTTALNALKRYGRAWTAYGIYKEIANNPGAYHASLTFSQRAVENALQGRPISKKTREILATFVRSHDPGLLPEPVVPVFLNIDAFLYCRKAKVRQAGEALAGDFQTYAVSTTADGYVRRGHVSFRYEKGREAIKMTERQVRPSFDGYPAYALDLEGYVAPKAEYNFALLRTVGDAQEATPCFFAMRPRLRDPKTGRINSMIGYATHFEPEKHSFMYPTVYLVRRRADDILCDFIPTRSLHDDAIRRALMLPPLIGHDPHHCGAQLELV